VDHARFLLLVSGAVGRGLFFGAAAQADNPMQSPNHFAGAAVLVTTTQGTTAPNPAAKPADPAKSGPEAQDSPSAIKGTPDEIQVLEEQIIEF